MRLTLSIIAWAAIVTGLQLSAASLYGDDFKEIDDSRSVETDAYGTTSERTTGHTDPDGPNTAGTVVSAYSYTYVDDLPQADASATSIMSATLGRGNPLVPTSNSHRLVHVAAQGICEVNALSPSWALAKALHEGESEWELEATKDGSIFGTFLIKQPNPTWTSEMSGYTIKASCGKSWVKYEFTGRPTNKWHRTARLENGPNAPSLIDDWTDGVNLWGLAEETSMAFYEDGLEDKERVTMKVSINPGKMESDYVTAFVVGAGTGATKRSNLAHEVYVYLHEDMDDEL